METNGNNLSGAQFGSSVNANDSMTSGGGSSFSTPAAAPGTANPGMSSAPSTGVSLPPSGIGGSS